MTTFIGFLFLISLPVAFLGALVATIEGKPVQRTIWLVAITIVLSLAPEESYELVYMLFKALQLDSIMYN